MSCCMGGFTCEGICMRVSMWVCERVCQMRVYERVCEDVYEGV